jgi:mRNA-degrading endonuclease RelE of RelBE toxin-antitoxin system
MYKIKLTGRAKKELNALKTLYQRAISLTFEELKENPFIGKPLTRELTGKFSYRVGVYRVIYSIYQKYKTITIITAGHRATIYQS